PKIHIPDKISSPHPNKRVISKLLPQQHIPYLPHPTPIHIIFNPLPLPSPMNIAQLLQLHLPIPPKNLPIHLPSPLFHGPNDQHLSSTIQQPPMPP
ncbi:hypothetical protein, partial [Staphylococcus saprophyticus]|uniref:hypothetical protein n=1 Tax=Staphylococcus saprophyticus TaxID=29385 RepID=UPI0011A8D2B1